MRDPALLDAGTEGRKIALGADGRAVRASFLNPRRDRGDQHVCGSDLTPEQAKARIDEQARITVSGPLTWPAIFTQVFEIPLLAVKADRESAYPGRWVRTDARAKWEKLSALTFAPRSVGDPPPVPVLIQHGEEDEKAPNNAASTTFDLLTHLGYTTRLLLYPGASHKWDLPDTRVPGPRRSERNTHTLRFLDHVLGWRPDVTLPAGTVTQVTCRMLAIAKDFPLPWGISTNERDRWVRESAAAYVAGRDRSITVKCEDSTPSGICQDLAEEGPLHTIEDSSLKCDE